MKKFLLLSFLSLFSTGALACTPGAGNGPTGDPNCMGGILNTDPYYNNSRSSQNTAPTKIIRHTTVNVPSKYGALAFSAKAAYMDGALNKNSKQEAMQSAKALCEKGSKGHPCKVITWVRNGCVAAAIGTLKGKTIVTQAADAPGKAETVALNRCQSSGAQTCEIIMPEGCSVPEGMYD